MPVYLFKEKSYWFFAQNTCDKCGGKTGLLGKRKPEDGNMCKYCGSALNKQGVSA